MSFPIVDPFPPDGDPNFNALAHACMDSMRVASVEANAAFNGLASAVSTVQAGLLAGNFDPLHAYAAGDRAFSLVNGFLYRRLSAGTNATDPSADPTRWALQTLMGYPLVVVNTSTHAIAAGTCMLIVYAGPVTLTAPAAVGEPEFAIKRANGRLDNVLTSSEPIEGQSSSIYLDGPWSDGLWRYFGATYGYGRY